MLSTVVSGRNSFEAVWHSNPEFRATLLAQKDPQDFGKWALRKPFQYVIPSLFIPCVAATFYEYFAATMGHTSLKVLDPCSGWGDRLTGAHCSKVVAEYVGVDPNSKLFGGYATINRLFGSQGSTMRSTMILQGFETAAPLLRDKSFDVVFTSPPFFDYEVYSPHNPTYTNWESQFYEPLVTEALRLVKDNGFIAFHIDDTTAGRVPHAIKSRAVATFAVDVGFNKRKISVWVIRACAAPTTAQPKRGRSTSPQTRDFPS